MKKIKKDLILFMPSIEGGGVEKNLFIIANFFSKKLNKIKLITYDNSFSNNFDKKIEIIYSKKKSSGESKYYKYFVCLWLLFKQFLSKKNILIFSFQANIYCLILSKILNFDIIIRSNSSPSGWSNSYIKNFIFKFFFKYAKEIIVNSYEFKRQLDKKFNINCKVIYNPLNKTEIKKKSREKFIFNFFQKKKYFKFINIARFTDQKDHITLLNAFKNINNKIKYKLLIMGYGTNKSKIINFIQENNLHKKIKVIRFQKNPYKFLYNSDVLVSTSIYEGLPNVLLEAQTLKKFIISSDCPTGPKEILNYGKYGYLFKTRSIKDLENKILNYKKNKKINKMIKKGYKNLDRFNLKNNNLKYLNLINNYLK
tara:strand:- start:993 stop:2096 length:1104 start_codon:yes stop_codon:yes gene_type:complete